MDTLNQYISQLEWLAALFLIVVGSGMALGILVVLWWYLTDRYQTRHAILRNYPLIGRFRYWFENLGEFFRQYFFAMDREELPFNRAQRSWVYRAAKGIDTTQAFGSTRPIDHPGDVTFVNSMIPVQEEDSRSASPITFGEGVVQKPYTTSSIFNISGMSFGAVSEQAVRALSQGAGEAGCWMNTGEGGLTPYHLSGGCDMVVQIGTAKYGVRDLEGNLCPERLREVAAHDAVGMFEIKLSQGAKPGKGGILPAVKVSPEIAEIRGIPQGQDSISPNRHAEVDSMDGLIDLICRIRDQVQKPVGIKFVLGDEAAMDQLCEAFARCGPDKCPDFITLDSADGGTGAAPLSLIDFVGMRLLESLPIAQRKLTQAGLRDRIRLLASGKLINPGGVAWALCLGADAVVSARGFMFALGCIQALQCNKNTCPAGITTQDPKLRRGLVVQDKAQRVASYQRAITREVEVIAHSCGVAEPRELRPHHGRIVLDTGRTVSLKILSGGDNAPTTRAKAAAATSGGSKNKPGVRAQEAS